ncbi:hypothetical protein [Arthrobacter sp. M4]|uniref:hypothetical protein n=1 Tax=Arthrobacter sp. M4 TaxID=218160 RepID=UPI001CDD1424|nr:hypothetical protein [Arthrobacter sp. M4]MCA4132463.1 hypothetical protein [Arthrobacter sp. M4]
MESIRLFAKPIVRSWAKIGVLRAYFESELPEAAAVEALERVRASLELPAAGTGLGGVAPCPLGAVVAIHGIASAAEAHGLLAALASGLEAQGIHGALRPLPDEHPLVGAPNLDMSGFIAGVCLLGETDPVRSPRRTSPPEVMDAVVDAALEWCQLPSGTHYVGTAWSYVKCTAEQRKALLATGSTPINLDSLACVTGPDEIRSVEFGDRGTVYFGRLDPDRRWEPAVADLTELLASLADQAEFGCIKRSRLGTALWDVFQNYDWPERPHLKYASVGRSLMDSLVPDAFGVQLLGPGHHLPAPLAPIWKAEPASAASTILEHTDLPAWFEGPLPEPETLEAARRSIEPLLMTTAQAEAVRSKG